MLYRMTPERLPQFGQQTVRIAAAISTRLGAASTLQLTRRGRDAR